MRGTLCLLAWNQTVSDCTSTPPTAQKTPTAAVEDAQAALDLGGEIDVAGRVDEGDAGVAPFDGDGGAVDGDALLPFQRIEVRGGVAVIHVADLVLGAAEIEDALGRRGFAGIHVSDDADVAKFFEHGFPACRGQGSGVRGQIKLTPDP